MGIYVFAYTASVQLLQMDITSPSQIKK